MAERKDDFGMSFLQDPTMKDLLSSMPGIHGSDGDELMNSSGEGFQIMDQLFNPLDSKEMPDLNMEANWMGTQQQVALGSLGTPTSLSLPKGNLFQGSSEIGRLPLPTHQVPLVVPPRRSVNAEPSIVIKSRPVKSPSTLATILATNPPREVTMGTEVPASSPMIQTRPLIMKKGPSTVAHDGKMKAMYNTRSLEQGFGFSGRIEAKTSGGGLIQSGNTFSSHEMMDALPNSISQGSSTVSIRSFDNSTTELNGYHRVNTVNVKNRLSSRLKTRLTEFSLGRPSVLRGGGGLFVVGTDNPDGKDSHLLCLNAEAIKDVSKGEVVKSSIPVSEHIRDTHWIAANVVLCATGQDVQLFEIQKRDYSFKLRGRRTLHHDLIREIAPNPTKPMEVASGGYDKKLCIHDLLKGIRLHEQSTSDTIGSVKWHPISNTNVLGCTLDYGGLQLFDPRIGFSKSSFKINTGKPELYTHCSVDENSFLLGYGDGTIQLVDQRYDKKILCRTSDPYVDGVGDIRYSPVTKSFVVSGLNDFTVWRHDLQSGEAFPWSHMSPTKSTYLDGTDVGFATSACYLDDDTIVMCDRNGYAGAYTQGFSKT